MHLKWQIDWALLLELARYECKQCHLPSTLGKPEKSAFITKLNDNPEQKEIICLQLQSDKKSQLSPCFLQRNIISFASRVFMPRYLGPYTWSKRGTNIANKCPTFIWLRTIILRRVTFFFTNYLGNEILIMCTDLYKAAPTRFPDDKGNKRTSEQQRIKVFCTFIEQTFVWSE